MCIFKIRSRSLAEYCLYLSCIIEAIQVVGCAPTEKVRDKVSFKFRIEKRVNWLRSNVLYKIVFHVYTVENRISSSLLCLFEVEGSISWVPKVFPTAMLSMYVGVDRTDYLSSLGILFYYITVL